MSLGIVNKKPSSKNCAQRTKIYYKRGPLSHGLYLLSELQDVWKHGSFGIFGK